MQATENGDSASNDVASLWSTAETARRLNVCKRTVIYWRDQGRLPHVRLGKSVRFIPSDVEEFIKAHRIGGAK